MNNIEIDIHGSCVSRNIFEYMSNIDINNYFFRNNIISCFTEPITNIISRNEFKHSFHYKMVKCNLEKTVINELLDSKSRCLIVDFFDFYQPVLAYKNSTFTWFDGIITTTKFYKDNKDKINIFNYLDIDTYLYYPIVDIYFKKMISKYGRENIILIRNNATSIYYDQDNRIKFIPENKLFFGNPKYNTRLRELEEYIIDKWKIYSVDLAGYYIGDYNFCSDITPVHYEESYYKASAEILENILMKKSRLRNNNMLSSTYIKNILHNNKIYEKRIMKCLENIPIIGGVFKEIGNWIFDYEEDLEKIYNFTRGFISYNFCYDICDVNDMRIIGEYWNKFSEKLDVCEDVLKKIETSKKYLLDALKINIEIGDLKWINILGELDKKYHDDEEVLFYSINYFISLDNKEEAVKYIRFARELYKNSKFKFDCMEEEIKNAEIFI